MTAWQLLVPGFLLGAAGSLHCVGMCGPLSMAIPVYHLSDKQRLGVMLLYQFGRIITYASLGLIFGIAGKGLFLSGFQQWFSIITGSGIVLLALFYFARKTGFRLRSANRFYLFVQKLIQKILLNTKNASGFFLIGMANGLLPCGMVYIALASTLSFDSVAGSVSFMSAFGAGTLPLMLLVGYSGKMISAGIRNHFKKMVPVFITFIGVILILRGMNLGIPFISPAIPANAEVINCHP